MFFLYDFVDLIPMDDKLEKKSLETMKQIDKDAANVDILLKGMLL